MKKKLFVLCTFLTYCIITISCSKQISTPDKPDNTEAKESTITNPEPSAITPLKVTSPAKAVQQPAILKNVCTIYMKDSNRGWALLFDGSLITTSDAWITHKEIHKFLSFNKDASRPSISCVNGTLIVIGYFNKERETVDIYRTKDNGDTWYTSHIKDSALKLSGGGDIFSSFIDKKNGYLLCCGSPACGLMPKLLFQTNDGGKTYKKTADISYIDGYPTGIAFNKDGNGYIASIYHGNDNAYLYISTDKGKTWNTSTVQPPKDLDYAYIDGFPPCFIGKDSFMILKYVINGDALPNYIMFCSSDEGKAWASKGCIPLQSAISSYCFSDKSTVYVIDDTGIMIKIVRSNDKWN
ncbi:WD40/YVTN/BNR-like repeat-containing protein [Anaerocolumna xylanovorans]|uniref:BNR/Asp-box repeat-containing protein n=1 Tax=Anaerocolumna xylanovorans DSM 12503 TaxID=1121345 RepID=A0A1M7YNI8_9FIRM|nr:hypothetical protein [Anaerocolumna xylanovorans]SHO54224.1 hypothetical protein SAMN02745217_04681 [Anaerocolumna xylanovorans DSM 12503]